MSIGDSYYTNHLANFNSLLADEIQFKNYASKTSMAKKINYAYNINTGPLDGLNDSHLFTERGNSKGLVNSLMNINENVVEGMTKPSTFWRNQEHVL